MNEGTHFKNPHFWGLPNIGAYIAMLSESGIKH
jgi:hypothetical protein